MAEKDCIYSDDKLQEVLTEAFEHWYEAHSRDTFRHQSDITQSVKASVKHFIRKHYTVIGRD